MGTLTQADFLTEILVGLGNRGDVPSSRLVTVLNLAQQRLSRAYDFIELQKITLQDMLFTGQPASDKIQPLPNDVKSVHSIVLVDPTALANSRKMIEKPWRWFDKEFPVPEFEAPSWPNIYTRWGTSIITYPVTQAAYKLQIRYNAEATPFSTSNVTQPSDFKSKDDILIYLSLEWLYRSQGVAMSDQADRYLNAAIQATKEAINREDTRPDMEVSADISDVTTAASGVYYADPFIRSVRSN